MGEKSKFGKHPNVKSANLESAANLQVKWASVHPYQNPTIAYMTSPEL